MAVNYETTWKTEPTAPPRITRRPQTGMPSGSVTRLIFGTVTIVLAVYAIIYLMAMTVVNSIGAAFGAEITSGDADLLLLAGLLLACGILEVATRWGHVGGIITGILYVCGAGLAWAIPDDSGMAGLFVILMTIDGIVCVFVSAFWGGTSSKI